MKMEPGQKPTRRLIVAGGFALAVLAPLVVVFAGQVGHPAPRTIAQTECDNGETMDDFTLQCVPELAPGGSIGAPPKAR
jgi:hypothetical protein